LALVKKLLNFLFLEKSIFILNNFKKTINYSSLFMNSLTISKASFIEISFASLALKGMEKSD
jgi:hypothetical protein